MAHPITTDPDPAEPVTLAAVPDAPDTPPEDKTAAGVERQPLFADWLRDRGEFVDHVGAHLTRAAHRTSWHSLRLPFYMARLTLFAPRGLGRVTRWTWDALTDGEGRPLRKQTRDKGDTTEWLKLRKERRDFVGPRQRNAMWLGGLLLGAGAAGWFLLPHWMLLALLVAAVQLLGWIGRPLGRQFVQPAILADGVPEPLRAGVVIEALCSLGIAKMTKPEEGDVRLLSDVARVGSVGYQVDIELPRGVTAGEVMERRGKLAAGLRRELGCVWPEVGARHEGHLMLYVSDQPMATAKQRAWPLLKDGRTDLFKPQPLFTDQRNKWLALVLAYTSGIIGAVPRQGKTFALRELLLVAGLDPRCKVFAFDLKGTGDLSPCALYAHRYSVGDEDEDIREQLSALRWLREELRRRAKVIRNLPREECPENKVTSELASRRDLHLEPIFVGVDEVQVWFDHEDRAIKNEFIAIATDLVKRGPALGIMFYGATQKPDAKSIPTGISDNAVVRFCLLVMTHQSNDQVLGSGAYKAGIRATMFDFRDKGVGYLRSDGTAPQIVRTVHGLNAVAAERVAVRARHYREQAGRLTGDAAGDVMESEADQVVLLDDLRQVMGNEPAGHLSDLAAGLAALRPATYGGMDASALGRQLRGADVKVDNVYVGSKPRRPRDETVNKGVKREWLDVSTTAVLGIVPSAGPSSD